MRAATRPRWRALRPVRPAPVRTKSDPARPCRPSRAEPPKSGAGSAGEARQRSGRRTASPGHGGSGAAPVTYGFAGEFTLVHGTPAVALPLHPVPGSATSSGQPVQRVSVSTMRSAELRSCRWRFCDRSRRVGRPGRLQVRQAWPGAERPCDRACFEACYRAAERPLAGRFVGGVHLRPCAATGATRCSSSADIGIVRSCGGEVEVRASRDVGLQTRR